MLEKVNHISFKNVDEAIMIAHFLESIGYKIDKKCFEKNTYLWNMSFGIPSIDDRELKYDGFTKVNAMVFIGKKQKSESASWRLTKSEGKLFTHTINGTCLIRKEKLKRLNDVEKSQNTEK